MLTLIQLYLTFFTSIWTQYSLFGLDLGLFGPISFMQMTYFNFIMN
jgi:hypothetical protein